MKRLMGFSDCLHYQRHFQSNRSRVLRILCDSECECYKMPTQKTATHWPNTKWDLPRKQWAAHHSYTQRSPGWAAARSPRSRTSTLVTSAATRFRSKRMKHLRPPRRHPFLTTLVSFTNLHSPEFRSHQSKTTDSVDAAYSLRSHEVIVHEGAGSKRRMVVLPESQFSVDATSMYNPNTVI